MRSNALHCYSSNLTYKSRARGRSIGKRFVTVRARAIYATLGASESFAASRKWRRLFMKRHMLVCLRKSNTKSMPVAARLPLLQEWHGKFSSLIATPAPVGTNPVPRALDPKYGRFSPKHRLNVDEVC